MKDITFSFEKEANFHSVLDKFLCAEIFYCFIYESQKFLTYFCQLMLHSSNDLGPTRPILVYFYKMCHYNLTN